MDHECGTHKFMTIVEGVKCHPSGGEKGHRVCLASQVVQVVKNLPSNLGHVTPRVQSLGQEDPLESMATHSSILAWRIPWTEEPGGLQSTGSQRVRHD